MENGLILADSEATRRWLDTVLSPQQTRRVRPRAHWPARQHLDVVQTIGEPDDRIQRACARAGSAPVAYGTHGLAAGLAFDAGQAAKLFLSGLPPRDAVVCTSRAMQRGWEALLGMFGPRRFGAPLLPFIPWGVDAGALRPEDPVVAKRRLGLDPQRLAVVFSGSSERRVQEGICSRSFAPCLGLPMRPRSSWPIRRHNPATSMRSPASPSRSRCSNRALWGRWRRPSAATARSDGRRRMPVGSAGRRAGAGPARCDGVRTTGGCVGLGGLSRQRTARRDGSCRANLHRRVQRLDRRRQPPPRCGVLSQAVVTDPVALSQAIDRLVSDPHLRAVMGSAGRARVLSEYAWSTIVARYQALWREQIAIRRAAREGREATRASWLEPQASVSSEALLSGRASVTALGRAEEWLVPVHAQLDAHIDPTRIDRLLDALSEGPRTLAELVGGDDPAGLRHALFLASTASSPWRSPPDRDD